MIIEIEREDDGRWIAEIPEIHGAMAYGQTRKQAIRRVKTLALNVMTDDSFKKSNFDAFFGVTRVENLDEEIRSLRYEW